MNDGVAARPRAHSLARWIAPLSTRLSIGAVLVPRMPVPRVVTTPHPAHAVEITAVGMR